MTPCFITFLAFILTASGASQYCQKCSASCPQRDTCIHDKGVCDNSPQEYSDSFAQWTGTGQIPRPACVADNLLGIVMAVPGVSANWQPTTLKPVGKGRRITFAVGPRLLETFYVYGNQGGQFILDKLGFGTDYSCDNCQFRLVVWQEECGSLMQGYWDNIPEILYKIYGSRTPNVLPALRVLKKTSFSVLTGCRLSVMQDAWSNPTILSLAGCSADWIAAMALFSNTTCIGSDSNNPQYTRNSGCPAETAFLALSNPTPLQLRAYLMATQGFFPLYTGYGFTANEEQLQPLGGEYWVPNTQISQLKKAAIIPFTATRYDKKPCSEGPYCAGTPAVYKQMIEAWTATASIAVPRPACVVDNMVGMFVAISGVNSDWTPTTLKNTGTGRRVAFVVGPQSLNLFYIYGQKGAQRIADTLGYGTGYTCNGCQFRLIVWREMCGDLIGAYWDNLPLILGRIYGNKAPDVANAVAELKSKTFTQLTGCDIATLGSRYWDPATMQTAGCSTDFITEAVRFAQKKCTTDTGEYNPAGGCPTEDLFLSTPKPSALAVRAFLLLNQGFFPQYTGYGQTANDYLSPLGGEFWVPNTLLTKKPDAQVITLQWS